MSNNPKAITESFSPPTTLIDVTHAGSCADGAQGRYLPMARTVLCRSRGGLEQIWRGFPQVVPDFGVEIAEMIRAKRTLLWCRHYSAGLARGCPRPL